MKEAEKYLKSLLNKNDTVVVATSGGGDSMSLLYVINNLKKNYNLNVICAHVNHNVRKESEREALFVKKYCALNNIVFEYMKIGKYPNNRFNENDARNTRYAFFETLLKKYNAKFLFTAHHGDDLMETILMRIVRGSNLKGYIGIPIISDFRNYKLVRPLLYVDKKEILAFLKDNNIKYVTDKSNKSSKYTRNRFRKRMLPFLKKEKEAVHLKFLKYSEELEEAHNYINTIVDKKYKIIVKDNIINRDKLLKEEKYVVKKIIEKYIENIQKDDIFDIDDKKMCSIINLVYSNNNKSINLDNNYLVRKSYNDIIFEKRNTLKKYKYIFKDELVILNKYILKKVNSSRMKNNNVMRINSEEVALPLIVRTVNDGDKIKVKGLNGSKKVNDIFIDLKIDVLKRKEYPIVCDSKNTVIWIPGLKKSIFDKEIYEKYDIIIKYVEE